MPTSNHIVSALYQRMNRVMTGFLAAIAFYTCLPVPRVERLNFQQVARWLPVVGVFLGGGLALLEAGLLVAGIPSLVRATLTVLAWVWVTGGLHLDGAMDTADGLAVDATRRLDVMADSRTGAFGVMAAIAILLLKTTALASLPDSGLPLVLAASWGRWAQQVAIARYPYLKPTGKGAFHKAALPSPMSILPGLIFLLGVSLGSGIGLGDGWFQAIGWSLGGGAIALIVPAWLNQQVGGQTGDTYGAAVEWTEALFLVFCTVLKGNSSPST